MKNLIFSGRFQPLHNGHINMMHAIKSQYPNDFLIVCIIRNSDGDEMLKPRHKNEFFYISKLKQQKVNNPLPNWERYKLLKLAIDNDEILKKNTALLFRDRSDLDWEQSVRDLPKDRVFIFPLEHKEIFDEKKLMFYREQGESCAMISKVGYETSGTEIRERLVMGSTDLSFLPKACRKYFQDNCMQYFRQT